VSNCHDQKTFICRRPEKTRRTYIAIRST